MKPIQERPSLLGIVRGDQGNFTLRINQLLPAAERFRATPRQQAPVS